MLQQESQLPGLSNQNAATVFAGEQAPTAENMLCFPQMWGNSRWAASVLLPVMLAPVFGPMAMPCCALPQAMHCMHQAVSGATESPHSMQDGMHCHHAMAQSNPPQAESPGDSLQANDDCCGNHHCCCGSTISEWAQPASRPLSFVSVAIEAARSAQIASVLPNDVSRLDSARAPPRS